jgi:Fe2+ or Zn2+ uptake regulation protein
MGKSKVDEHALTTYILKNIETHQKEIVSLASKQFNVSRQTIYRYLKKIVEQKHLEIKSDGRYKIYKLKNTSHTLKFKLHDNKIDEEEVWRLHVNPLLPKLSGNVNDICHYGIGEMVNNVLEHSGAKKLEISIIYNAVSIMLCVMDDGIGIFTKVQKDFNLAEKNHAILELAKGKLTSDPSHHSGEGIFFTSRMYDDFIIMSEDLVFIGHDHDDWLFPGRNNFVKGTWVYMRIELDSDRTMKDVFDRFTPEINSDNYGFLKTIVPVKLLQYEGESLVSRSQAKRLLSRFDQFKEVILDFEGIIIIGQPFADEVFRVFQKEHPDTHLYPININEDIERMIKHVSIKPNID